MSDYMFMLESHLSALQNRVLSEVQQAAAQANVNLFLTGGAVRDMLGGYQIRDLDFTVVGNARRLAKALAAHPGVRLVALDEHRRSAELVFPGRVTVSISMARQEHYPKAGGAPVINPATIQDDLRCRDFTINAMALSLNRASLGLLLDPTNGQADLEQKELRAVHNRVLYDDPARLLRLIRFKVRYGMTVEEKTARQYENVRLEEMEKRIPPRRLFEELAQIACEPNPGEVLQALEAEKLLNLFLPASASARLNLSGFGKLQKVRQLIPFGVEFAWSELPLFLFLLLEKLTPAERKAFAKATGIHKSEMDLAIRLQKDSKKLERELRAAKITRPSHIYKTLVKAPGEQVLYLYLTSTHRLVQDRIRNYLQKYLPAAQEITDRQVEAAGAQPGTAKFKALKDTLITARLDGRQKKASPPAGDAAAPEPGQASSPALTARGK